MNKDIISFKATEYIGRAGVALHRGDLEKARNDTRTVLVLYRLQARETVANLIHDTEELRSFKPKDYAMSEMKRRITEALLQDDRIISLSDWEFEPGRKSVRASFVVHTIYGDIEASKEVDI